METNTDKNTATALANTDPSKEYATQQDKDITVTSEASETEAAELLHGEDSDVDGENDEDEDEGTRPISPLKTVRDDMELRPHDMEDEKE